MARRKRNPGALAGWLFADLALMLSFVFLDSSTSGRSGAEPATTSTVVVTDTTVDMTSTTVPVVSPQPIPATVRTRLLESPGDLINAIEEQIRNSNAEEKFKNAQSFLVVLIRIGSKGHDRKFAAGLASKVENILNDNWDKVSVSGTFYDRGDDNELDYGKVTLKLFPVAGG